VLFCGIFALQNVVPIADVVVVVLLSFLSMGLKKYFKL